MNTFAPVESLEEIIDLHFADNTLVKATLSKPRTLSAGLKNVYVKPVEIRSQLQYSFTYRYATKDEVKNFEPSVAKGMMMEMLNTMFQNAVIQTKDEEISLVTSKKGNRKTSRRKLETLQEVSLDHDRKKNVYVDLGEPFLHHLGVSDAQGQLIPRMADKYRQINKYLEVIDHLVIPTAAAEKFTVADMGSGKGYLTFALYNFLVSKGLTTKVTGVEQRPDLVAKCNAIAQTCGFAGLSFVQSSIGEFATGNVDMLIALHACDTATDDAIAQGIKSNASVIVCAPCCHKQIRQQLKGKTFDDPLLKYGIYKERMFEMVTDTIRSLVLEREGYKSNLFEFISSEHTSKNIMLTAVKSDASVDKIAAQKKIDLVKKEYQIDFHYLEKLIS